MNYVSLFAFLAFASFVNANTALPDNRHIVVTGEAQLKAKPDIAVINLEVESLQVSSLDAKKDVDNRINSFLAGLSKFNIDEKNVSASSINTQPSYSYTESDKQQLEGYTANRSIKVTLTDIKRLNALLDFALSVKIDAIKSIELKSSAAKALKAQVNAMAVNDAKEKASSLAKAFGTKLGSIYSINSAANNSFNRYGENQAIDRIVVSGNRTQQFTSPGKYLQENIVFSASVSAVFDLELTDSTAP
ncbi:SIMPL domain-containing protein [Pseudoalteromonas rhizosphaerae]|uniref:SIMPL domain-containing protein n=1 Tax=Pseudoalteromonas rhizosphaerae TaxID=2518973 RepID=UPI0030D98BE7|tara:strand:- start:6855 stop:7595 length:741 start_codon:yes stop_codon:yes gene_type:complete